MIIFGTRGVTSSVASGNFHCPACGRERPYQHKRVRRFFTLYFLPIIPLKTHGEYIECEHCHGTFQMRVLEFDAAGASAAFEAEFQRAIKRVMVEMMLADKSVDDEEVATAQRIYQQVAGTALSDDDIRAAIVDAETELRGISAALAPIAPNLNDNGKEMVIRAAFLIAAADGEFHEDEKALLADIGRALEMTPAHLNGVIASMTQSQ